MNHILIQISINYFPIISKLNTLNDQISFKQEGFI